MSAIPASARQVFGPGGSPGGASAAGGVRADAWTLRLVTFCALALFGGIHWAGIVRPGAGGDLLGLFFVAVVGGLFVAAAVELRPYWVRVVAVLGIVLVALLLILAISGVDIW